MNSQEKSSIAPVTLRIVVMCCFIAHGTLALKNSHIYYSEWSQWVQSLFPADQKYQGSALLLQLIGTLDILAGLSFLLPRIPLAGFAWTIGWGSVTALSRIYFLGSIAGPFWENMVFPMSQLLIRIPNALMTIILLAQIYRDDSRLDFLAEKTPGLIHFGAFTQVLGFAMIYLVDLNKLDLSSELLKIGMPTYFFHAAGVLALVGALFTIALFKFKSSQALRICAGSLALIAYVMVEGFEVFHLNAPHGFIFTAIRVLEHMPVYLCLGYFLEWSLDQKQNYGKLEPSLQEANSSTK